MKFGAKSFELWILNLRHNMQLIEEYQELIERDMDEISPLWKYIQMFLYFLCTIGGYICSVLFYTLWQGVFGGDCLLWAKFIILSKVDLNDMVDMYEMKSNYTDWWTFVVMDSESVYRCNIYLITCFLSCIFGITWFTFFFMCGIGGHNVAIYESPWRIVLPAVLFNFFFTILSMYANYNVQQGLKEFNKNIKNVFFEIYGSYIAVNEISECKIIQTYVEMSNFDHHDICKILVWLQFFSIIMTWSWIGGLILLILRILIIVDFNILKVRIYKLPLNDILDTANQDKTTKDNDEKNRKRK